MYSFSSTNNYKLKLVFVILIIILINLILIPKKNWKENLAQDIRINTCQPNFTDFTDSQKFKIKNLFLGLKNFVIKGCDFDTLKIDISLKNFNIIKEDRKIALKNTILTKPREVPATLIFQGKKYRADIRLKGDLPNHWTVKKQWSLRIELKDKKSIHQMREFSITKLKERSYPDNLIISNQFKRLDLISPNFKIFKLNVNGENWGLMLAEEQFSSVFFENRKLKDGLISKFTNEAHFFIKRFNLSRRANANINVSNKQGRIETKIFNKKKIYKRRHFLDQESLLRSINIILNSDKSLEEKKGAIYKYFDIRKLAQLVATSVVFQSPHTLQLTNTRFYLNPYNLKLEPIPTDNRYEKVSKDMSLNDYKKLINSSLNMKLFQILFQEEAFLDEYKNTLEKIKNDLNLIIADNHELCKKFDSYCKEISGIQFLDKKISKLINIGDELFKNLKKDELKDNEKKFPFFSNTDIEAVSILNSFIYARMFNGYIKFYNLSFQNIKLKKINIYFKSEDKPNCEIFVKKSCKNQTFVLNKVLPKSPKNLIKDFKLPIENNDSVWAEIEGSLNTQFFKFKTRLENNKFDDENILKTKPFNKTQLKKISEKTFLIDGEYEISQPIVLPKNFNLKINSGSVLKFSENSYIFLDGGNLILDGKNSEINLLPQKTTWGGIYVKNAKSKSIIINTKIKSTKNFTHEGIVLSGGVNFYKSDIEIKKSIISDSKAEDSINIIKSSFDFENFKILNSISDAIDSDFSSGKIINSFFKDIKGDAIDTSGSVVSILSSQIYNVSDKALSAGENSEIYISDLDINNARFGIVSKDLSNIKGNKIQVTDSIEYDVIAFEKKSHYGPGYIDIENVKYEDKVIAQTNSEIKVNNKKISTTKLDISKYY